MLGRHVGEAAAVGTATLWAATYVLFTISVRAIGPERLNRWRLLFALSLLLIAHAALFRAPFPMTAEPARWAWLTGSGVVGFAVSDACLFHALLRLGPHRTSLVMAGIPVVSALMAWGVFGERLTAIQAVAGLVVVAGIVLVVSARSMRPSPDRSRSLSLGVGFALGAATCQSFRYILSKQGMVGGFPVLSTNVIQILAATVATWAVAAASRRWRGDRMALRSGRAVVAAAGGAFTGPFLGVTLSLVALARAPVGIASTLMALPPILLLPMSRVLFKEPITVRAAVGTGMAVAGGALLFLS
jgi:drug/metabolite transporter (DMT)-like permease